MITFLSVDQVAQLHQIAIRDHGGSSGIRDRGLLESAVMTPRQAFGGEYAHPTVGHMAGAYLFHLVKNHPFHDGNKRVAALAMETFLIANGYQLSLTDDQLVDLTEGLAASRYTKGEGTRLILEHLVEPEPDR